MSSELEDIILTIDACKKCGGCCKAYPCGLRPDELKPIADFLKISVKELINSYLIQDYFIGEPDLYYLCCKRKGDTDKEASYYWAFLPIPCIFLTDNNLCQIHEVKPLQGKHGIPCKTHFEKGADAKRKLVELWQPFDKTLKELYES